MRSAKLPLFALPALLAAALTVRAADAPSPAAPAAAGAPPVMDSRATLVPPGGPAPAFAPDPVNTQAYDFQSQVDVYGAKHPNPTARPLIDEGRELYGAGEFPPSLNLFGVKNPADPQLLVYGDFRTVGAWNDNGGPLKEKGEVAAKADIDVDLQLTGTERIHYFFTPLNDGADFTRWEFDGARPRVSKTVFDLTPGALFFEGDAGNIAAGLTNRNSSFDLPFTFGRIPLLFQNGVWLEDAFDGFAFTIPARNSPALQITNMDVTFFAGFDDVTTPALNNANQGDVFGVNAFIESDGGYWEMGYGYVDGLNNLHNLSYNNATIAFTHRYFDRLSNSIRIIGNFGQNPGPGQAHTADGAILLVENSLITSKPLTLVPYLNGWIGSGRPQSLARAANAGGVLLNTGIVFETDGITGFPKMDDTGHNTYGAALGVEYLFDLHQQIVFEIAGLNTFGRAADRTTPAAQYGAGIRWQLPLNNAWILRADTIAAVREQQQNLLGFRLELRRKF